MDRRADEPRTRTMPVATDESLAERIATLKKLGSHPRLLDAAARVANLKAVVPNLVSFPRDPTLLAAKRLEIGRMIVAIDKALDESP